MIFAVMSRKLLIFFFLLTIFFSFHGHAPAGTSYEEDHLTKFLTPSHFIDSDNPKIMLKALELTKDCPSVTDKAKALFEYVRDSYNNNTFESYKASDILEKKGNLCYQRAILLAALCRATGIPSRLHWQKVTIRGWKNPDGTTEDGAFIHGLAGIFLNGHWHLYEATGNREKWTQFTQNEEAGEEITVRFFPDRDCLFASTEKVILETLPLYSADWSGDVLKALDKSFIGDYTDDPSDFLSPGLFIDSSSPKILLKAGELTQGCKTDAEKAEALFNYVRDSYSSKRCETYKASEVLECGGNSCHRRSILLAALCRAVGIPARLHWQKVTLKDYRMEDGNVSDFPFVHGITGMNLDGEWFLYEPVGNREKWAVWIQEDNISDGVPVKFSPHRNCLFPQTNKVFIETLPIYFKDWSEETAVLMGYVNKGDVGFF
jgi:transglutaminase-like putative cysteine protease